MSERTPCNYCSLKWIREDAKENGLKVTLVKESVERGWLVSGITAYVHPKDVIIKGAGSTIRDKYFTAWFMELPDHCCC